MTRRPRRSRKRRPNWPVRLVLMGLVVSFFLFALIVPMIRFRLETDAVQRERWDYLIEQLLSHEMAWFIVLWVFFFGTCLGSFLNVVAYRIPNGMTILGTSRCPWCLVPIQSRHNFPILGWLTLRGRCAACRLPISVRYVLVEIMAGGLLLWLFLVELAADGQNLPGEINYKIGALFRHLASGEFKGLWNFDWSLVRIFLVHCIVGYTLLTAALMRLDRLPLPVAWKLTHWCLVMTLLIVFPGDFEFARTEFQAVGTFKGWFQRLDFQLTGMAIGGLLGFQFQQILGDRQSGLLFAFVLLGTCCGLSATISIGFVFLSLVGFLAILPTTRAFLRHPLFLLLMVFLFQVAAWNSLDDLSWWLGHESNSLLLIGFLLPGTVATVVITSYRAKQLCKINISPGPEAGSDDTSSTQ